MIAISAKGVFLTVFFVMSMCTVQCMLHEHRFMMRYCCPQLNCSSLPDVAEKDAGVDWVSRVCYRQQCWVEPCNGATIAECDYLCIDTLRGLSDTSEFFESKIMPIMIPFWSAWFATTPAMLNAIYRGHELPLKHVFGYAGAGFLWGMSCMLIYDSSMFEKTLFAATSSCTLAALQVAVTEYMKYRERKTMHESLGSNQTPK